MHPHDQMKHDPLAQNTSNSEEAQNPPTTKVDDGHENLDHWEVQELIQRVGGPEKARQILANKSLPKPKWWREANGTVFIDVPRDGCWHNKWVNALAANKNGSIACTAEARNIIARLPTDKPTRPPSKEVTTRLVIIPGKLISTQPRTLKYVRGVNRDESKFALPTVRNMFELRMALTAFEFKDMGFEQLIGMHTPIQVRVDSTASSVFSIYSHISKPNSGNPVVHNWFATISETNHLAEIVTNTHSLDSGYVFAHSTTEVLEYKP